MYRKFVLLTLIINLLFLTTGCWGKRELGEISIVRVTGIDVEENGQIRVTVLAEEPMGQQGENNMRSSTWIGTAASTNIREAMKELLSISAKRPVWIHNDVIIISEEAAKTKLNEVVDFIARSREIRYNNKILISHDRALDILQLPSSVQGSLIDDIDGRIKNAQYWSKIYISDLKEFLKKYSDDNTAIVTGEIGYYMSDLNTVSTRRESYEMMDSGKHEVGIPYIRNSAIIKRGKMVGRLDSEETKGYLWIAGKVKEGLVEAQLDDKDSRVVIVAVTSQIKLKSEIKEENIIINIELNVNGDLGINTAHNTIASTDFIKIAEAAVEEKVKSQMESAVKKAQTEYNADIFGFSDIIRITYPEYWKEIENNWDEIFPSIEVRYDIKCIIKRVGMINQSLGNE